MVKILDFTQAPDGVYTAKWKVKPQVVVKGAGYSVISPGVLNDEFVHETPSSELTSPEQPKEEGAFYDFKAGKVVQKMQGFREITVEMNKRTLDEVVGRRARIVGEKQIGDLSAEQIYMQDLEQTGRSLDATI